MSACRSYRYFYEIDYSRFDASISLEMMACFELQWLCLVYPPEVYPEFASALVSCLSTRGVSDVGITYRTYGTRCSGDAHTSIGNGILNHFLTFLMTSHLSDVLSYHEGDDGLICTLERIDHWFTILPTLGFLIKLDLHSSLTDAAFCGMYLCDTPSGLSAYSDPERTLVKLHVCKADGLPQNLLFAKALSVLSLNPCTPIITAWCQHILRCVDTPLSKPSRRHHLLRTIARIQSGGRRHFVSFSPRTFTITSDVRAAFAHRTGISPALQVAYESYLLALPFVPSRYHLLKRDLSIDTLDSTLHNFIDVMAA